METFKKILLKCLFPPVAVIWIVVPIAAGLLIYAFGVENANPYIAYFSYFLSAYALTVLCTKAPVLFRALRAAKEENKYIQMYINNPKLRIKLSLYSSLAINAAYALLQLFSGFYYRSIWFFALCVYYILLASMRIFLLRDTIRVDLGKDQLSELRRYRFCGILLLLVNLALAIIVTYIVWQNRGFAYNEILTIAMAAYTFFSMTKAIINVVRYRRYESPVMSAAKAISLAAALVSMLSLETAMLTAFGGENSAEFRQTMTAATGSAVCLLVLAMAIYMIIRSTKAIKKIKRGVQNRG
ncbi:MAG: hypothetical protein IJ333_09960 [Clostridia bacterium]|nr:hypothetical protein [Clostridia bacterium]